MVFSHDRFQKHFSSQALLFFHDCSISYIAYIHFLYFIYKFFFRVYRSFVCVSWIIVDLLPEHKVWPLIFPLNSGIIRRHLNIFILLWYKTFRRYFWNHRGCHSTNVPVFLERSRFEQVLFSNIWLFLSQEKPASKNIKIYPLKTEHNKIIFRCTQSGYCAYQLNQFSVVLGLFLMWLGEVLLF